ncbi:MAG: BatD family protein [Myxococcota bacterium]
MVSAGLLLLALGQVTVEVSVSTQRLEPDEFLNVQIRAVGQGSGRLDIDVPPVDGLSEVGRARREGTSFSISSSGRTMTRELVMSLDYSADRTGAITFPSVRAHMGDEEAFSKPLQLRVGGAKTPAPAPVPPAALPKGAVSPPRPDERDVFLRYVLSKDRAFTGDQVLVDMVLYSRSLPRDVDPDPTPSPDGAWRQMLGDARRLAQGRAQVGGKAYRTVRLWRMALFGLQPGLIELPAYEAGIWMNSGPFARGKRLRRSAVPRQLEILPLPEAGRPPGFSAGNVGRYRFRASVDQREVDASRGLVLTLEAQGTGNLPQLQLPSIEGLDDWRVFPPTITSDLEASADEVRGVKRAQILLTPTRTGSLEIPSFSLATFDAERRVYAELETRPIPITVSGRLAPPRAPAQDENAEASDAPPSATAEKAPPAPNLRPILPDPEPMAELDRIPLWALLGSFGTPWATALMLVLFRRRRSAPPMVASGADEILEAARAGRPEAWRSARDLLLERCGFDPARPPGLEDLQAELRARGAGAAEQAMVARTWAQADAARFAPSLVEAPDVEALRAILLGRGLEP